MNFKHINQITDDQLLDIKISNLSLSTPFTKYVNIIRKELKSKGITLPINIYPSTEWFVADSSTAIAFPFYLLHPRLTSLQRKIVGFSEGETKDSFLKLLRHELGHAIDNSYNLKRASKRAKIFGPASTPYPSRYSYNPYSRSFVKHISPSYAQSHPAEDFAETFAIWLNPKSNWQKVYKNWPTALLKLQFIDNLMSLTRNIRPKIKAVHVSPIQETNSTLQQFFSKQAKIYNPALLEHRHMAIM